jgi:hypothetical protein
MSIPSSPYFLKKAKVEAMNVARLAEVEAIFEKICYVGGSLKAHPPTDIIVLRVGACFFRAVNSLRS